MSGSALAVIVIPVVVGIILAGWLYAVFHADRHPEPGNSNIPPDRAVTGGIFRSSGGRQQMPRRDATPPEAAETPNGN